MDQKQIEDIVRAVLTNINANGKSENVANNMAGVNNVASAYNAGSTSAITPTSCAEDGGALQPDLGSDEVKNWIGVQTPIKPEVLVELKRSTASRVAAGRTGPRLRTRSYLRFLADHSRSKDTVIAEVPSEWIKQHNLLEVRTEVESKDQYLTRPDLGRRLSSEAIEMIKSQCKMDVDVQVVVSDGLSTEAIMSNYDEIIPPLMKGLESTGLKIGNPFFVHYGRVKVEDQIGELLKAKVVILLIGERPGLGQSESLSCYMIYGPSKNTVEADRTCISNIHKQGTPSVEAAAVIVDMAQKMIKNQASGIKLATKGA